MRNEPGHSTLPLRERGRGEGEITSCDIFCNIIDNYGDIGVCWRLARQLAHEHGLAVRLWLDDLNSLAKLCHETDAARDVQHCRGVEVRRWTEPFSPLPQPLMEQLAIRLDHQKAVAKSLVISRGGEMEVADLVIEAFACKLPQGYLEAMAAQEHKPVWINLEYLSAEDWVSGCHGLPSPHPSLPLTRYFFFPGFTRQTGGLLLEHDLFAQRDAFHRDAARQQVFWQSLGMEMPSAETLKVSLFGYENDALAGLFDVWASGAQPVLCLVPEGRILPQVEQYFADTGRDSSLHAGTSYCRGEFIRPWADKSAPTELLPMNRMVQAISKQTTGCVGINPDLRRGSLQVCVLPFVEQERYDELLWACDVNFVRGEDSCVRAQWAARPFVWQIYPQHDAVHWQKLQAFLNLYSAPLSAAASQAMQGLWRAWNSGGEAGQVWPVFAAVRGELDCRAQGWARELAANNLALNLLDFSKKIGRMRAFKIDGQ